MIAGRVLKFFKKKEPEDAEIAFYNAEDNNYFESFYPLIIEDDFKGTIICLEDVLVKKHASFSGELICKRCLIEGSLTGNILATEYTGIGKSACLDAGILTGSILIANQAAAVGKLRISKEIRIPESFKTLEVLYKRSLKDENTGTEAPKVKKIILKKGSAKTLCQLPGKVPPPAAEIPELEKGVPQISFEQPPLAAPEEKKVDNANSGWW